MPLFPCYGLGNDINHPCLYQLALCRDDKITLHPGTSGDRIGHGRRKGMVSYIREKMAVKEDRLTVRHDMSHCNCIDIVEEENVRMPEGSNGPEVAKSIIICRIDRRHLNRLSCGDTETDRFADNRVEIAFIEEHNRIEHIGNKQDTAVVDIQILNSIKLVEFTTDPPFTDHHRETKSQFFKDFLYRCRFVARCDTGENIFDQSGTPCPCGMSIEGLAESHRCPGLFQHPFVTVNDAGPVGFTDTDKIVPFYEVCELFQRKS